MLIQYMNIKNIKPQLIGLLVIVIVCWIVLYLIPEIVVSLFNTILGNLLLFLVVLITYANHRYLGIAVAIICIVFYRFVVLSKEGFTQQSVNEFLRIQNTIHRHKIFDIEVMKTQASQEELDYFNAHGKWPWSNSTIQKYKNALSKNPYVRVDPTDAVNYARTIYNEQAILRILYNQSDEGQFLIHGVRVKDANGNSYEELPDGVGSFVYESGLQPDLTHDVIRCSMKDENNPTMERIRYTGRDSIFGAQTEQRIPVDYHALESIIPTFKFTNQPCNPCGALASTPDYSCKFSLHLKK